ncbi:MAG: PKD domain-containing protein, partial [bacterium]
MVLVGGVALSVDLGRTGAVKGVGKGLVKELGRLDAERLASETVSTPSTPAGPAGGTPGTSYSYSTGGATSSLGDAVEYRFDWGDGTFSAWSSSASASHAWAASGTYPVKVQARCGTHTGKVSGWS